MILKINGDIVGKTGKKSMTGLELNAALRGMSRKHLRIFRRETGCR